MFENYCNWITRHSLGDHSSVVGLLITIVGFILTFIKLWLVGRNNRTLQKSVQEAILGLGKIDTLKELATLIERLRNLNSLVMTADSMDLAKGFSDYRSSLTRLRESSSTSISETHSTIQSVLTQLSNIEDRLVGSVLNDTELTSRKRQSILKVTNSCLDELQAFIQQIQNHLIPNQ